MTARPHSDWDEIGAEAFRAALDGYLALHDALAADRLDPARAAAERVVTHLSGDAQSHAQRLAASADLASARAAFGELSAAVVRAADAHGLSDGLVRMRCGMADAPYGGVWLQPSGPTRNPFFGAQMLGCGSSIASLPDAPAHAH
jgi:Cu(I)/Ag(I) efflux system membrane fusion protein